jgi:hypothetical protein
VALPPVALPPVALPPVALPPTTPVLVNTHPVQDDFSVLRRKNCYADYEKIVIVRDVDACKQECRKDPKCQYANVQYGTVSATDPRIYCYLKGTDSKGSVISCIDAPGQDAYQNLNFKPP